MKEIHKITRSIETCKTFLYFNTETLYNEYHSQLVNELQLMKVN